MELFFDAMLKLLTPQELKDSILGPWEIKNLLNFIKNCTKKLNTNTLTRARIYINFLLNFDAVPTENLVPFLDPFRREAEYFGSKITSYIVDHNNVGLQVSIISHLVTCVTKKSQFYASLFSLIS